MEFFYKIHDPTTANRQGPDVGTQYHSAIFYHSPEQKVLAEKVTKQIQEKLVNEKNLYSERKIVTEIVEAGEWYNAEDYHQKYLVRREKKKKFNFVMVRNFKNSLIANDKFFFFNFF